jgi:homoaconitase/3-isopropylmalate dehydratase large subunit
VQRKCTDRDLKISKVTESVNIKEVRKLPIPVTSRVKAWVSGRSLVGIVGSNPAAWKSASCERCLLSGRGL